MLKVDLQNKPEDFDSKVRQPGLDWMLKKGIDTSKPVPDKVELPDYWRKCRDDLRLAFGKQCCYTGFYLRKSEVVPVEHALPKKLRPDLAYEWSNYRYAATRINSRKGIKIVLDPAHLPAGIDVFHMEFVDGSIFPNPALEKAHPSLYLLALNTILDLGLDDGLYRGERMDDWDSYLSSSRGSPEVAMLEKQNRFVWYEARRQGLL